MVSFFSQLSDADRQIYDQNVDLIESLQHELKKKKEQYKNNELLYERFIPGIEMSIEVAETENKNLLDPQVLCLTVGFESMFSFRIVLRKLIFSFVSSAV